MNKLYDNHGRIMNYLRLAVTDRCNLRCFYCMPQEGIQYLPKKALLTFEEIERLVKLMASMGISKVRLTGGEPFVRNDLMKLIAKIKAIDGVQDLHITTNGVLTAPHVPELKTLGVASVNLSLDTLDREKFKAITYRDELDRVLKTFDVLLENQLPVKINAVVMEDKNTDDILPMIELTRHHDVAVRFIEEMPFNGGGHYPTLTWTYRKILEHITNSHPNVERLPGEKYATSDNYRIPGYRGSFGIIAAFSRTFCGTCNRIRVTAQGTLKTCLYDNGVLDIKALMRSGLDDEQIKKALSGAFQQRTKNGFEAEQQRSTHQPAQESMSTIGG